ncbi:MAG TPA: polyprenyl diphosphate synthase [Burkholderiaceae bacterium]|nr:polyprenyl diphosphate synthase [Burkholderiaceae bacterium]
MPISLVSSTAEEAPEPRDVPRHVAIIMDGNGRWATARHLPRVAGHGKGVDAVRKVVEAAARRGVEFLTLFAFSSENWRRPADEVSMLMRLFVSALEREVTQLKANGIRLRVVGDLSAFEPRLQRLIEQAQLQTATNQRMTLTVAANYGGRWDILQAVRRLFSEREDLRSEPQSFCEGDLAPYLALSHAPEPDLFIRTGGEQRISNFLLWQLAYTELYFTETYWPDFDARELDLAIQSYRRRERRFGRTSAQLAHKASGAG